MADALKSLVDELTSKTGQIQTILDLGPALTQEKLEEAKALKSQCVDLKTRIDAFQGLKADLDGLNDYLTKPVRTVPFDGKPAAGTDGAFTTLGTVAAGSTLIDAKSREIVFEDGPGAFGGEDRAKGERLWRAINSDEYRKGFREYLRRGGNTRFMELKTLKVLEEGLDDQGGYTVPVDMISRVIMRQPTPTRVAGMVANINTSREFLEMIKVNCATDNIYSTGFRVTKTGENPASTTAARVTDTNLFGTIKIPVHTFMITGLLTNNMVEDSALNLIQWVSDKFNETVDILRDDKVINGTGKMEPRGMVNAVASSGSGGGTDDPLISYIPTGDANLITPDSLISVAEDVPEQYEDGCKYLFNKTSTYKAIKLLKDLNDRYLFGAGTQESGLNRVARPTELNGYPFVFSGLMPNIAANNIPVLFGDFRGYQLVNRIGFSIQVLREVYAELNQVALVGRIRFGGQVIEPWRLRALKVALT